MSPKRPKISHPPSSDPNRSAAADEETEESEEIIIVEEEEDDEDDEEETEDDEPIAYQKPEVPQLGRGSGQAHKAMADSNGERKNKDEMDGLQKRKDTEARKSGEERKESNGHGDGATNQEDDDEETDVDDPNDISDRDDEGEEDDDPEYLERRRQIITLMCFSSLQTLMATELCRDSNPPVEEICTENSTIFPLAFLKLVMLALPSLMPDTGQECWKFQSPESEWTPIERGIGTLDAVSRDSLWRSKYGMSYPCFLYVVDELRPYIQSEAKRHVRDPIEVERAVAMVLYRLANGFSAHQVAEKYNVGASSVGKYTLIIASALADANKLYGDYMAIPTGDRMAKIISKFEQITRIPNMCGAIDGTHIKLYFKPEKCYMPSAYLNPYKFHSILLQGVCDANKIFWDVCCLAPGGTHDASHFMASHLYQKIKEGLSLREPVITVEGVKVSPFIVGDSAYPIRPFIMKPFDTDDTLRTAFDEHLRKGLACIEDAFTILKSRWRILKSMNVHLMHASQIAVACCVLHNICQAWGEPDPQKEQMETYPSDLNHGPSAPPETDETAKLAGESVRDALFKNWVKRSP